MCFKDNSSDPYFTAVIPMQNTSASPHVWKVPRKHRSDKTDSNVSLCCMPFILDWSSTPGDFFICSQDIEWRQYGGLACTNSFLPFSLLQTKTSLLTVRENEDATCYLLGLILVFCFVIVASAFIEFKHSHGYLSAVDFPLLPVKVISYFIYSNNLLIENSVSFVLVQCSHDVGLFNTRYHLALSLAANNCLHGEVPLQHWWSFSCRFIFIFLNQDGLVD